MSILSGDEIWPDEITSGLLDDEGDDEGDGEGDDEE